MKLGMFIIYVKDQDKAYDFYSKLFKMEPVLNVPGMTEFKLDGVSLGIMPETGMSNLLNINIDCKDNNNAKCELYLFVEDPEECLTIIEEEGGKIISPAENRPWGDYVGYGMDPFGNLIALSKK